MSEAPSETNSGYRRRGSKHDPVASHLQSTAEQTSNISITPVDYSQTHGPTSAACQLQVSSTTLDRSSQSSRVVPLAHEYPDLEDRQNKDDQNITSSTQQVAQAVAIDKKTSVKTPSLNSRSHQRTQMKKKIPREMQAQWRVGAAPSVALRLSKEESEVTKIISQATAFHTSMFETIWGPGMRQNKFVFDLDNRVELFRDSSVTATCLVAAGRPISAQNILNRVLPDMDKLLQHPHPQLYLILAELSLGLVKTPNDAARDHVVRYIAERARMILGPEDPLTCLLTLNLPQTTKEALGERLWTTLLPILSNTFGADHYQSSTQIFCHARNIASSGRMQDAIEMVENLLHSWSDLYGPNSLIVCYTKIELANMLANAGSSLKAEFVVSDALRTSDIIYTAQLRNEDCHVTENRHRAASIAFSKVAGLRTMGKIYTLRRNFGAAVYYYSQAATIGSAVLGENSATVELAQFDLASAQKLELDQAMQQLSISEVSNLTHIIGSPVS